VFTLQAIKIDGATTQKVNRGHENESEEQFKQATTKLNMMGG
jgi:hypothetical protein